jgi:hypothetical protein
MKKLLLCVLFLSLALPITAQNEIPNWNMETWDSSLVLLPHQWQLRLGGVSRVAGHNGSYACQLVNDPIKGNPGVILDGLTSNGQTFTGGTPFTERPDSIKMFCKYTIVAGDTAFILVLLKKQGTPICYEWIPIAGGHAAVNTFTQITRKITYSDTNKTHMPDSLIVGVICSNPNNNGTWPVGDTLIVDDISFSGATTAIPNATFEAWDSRMSYTARGWYGVTSNSDTSFSMKRTTDKFAGTYAVLVQSSVSSADTMYGVAATTPLKDSITNKPSFPVSQHYENFSFAYKYLPQNGDTMKVNAGLYKNHVEIGWASYSSAAKDSVWKQVTVPINYNNQSTTIIPDSATIFLSAMGSDHPRGNSMLYVDNLAFIATNIIVKPMSLSSGSVRFSAKQSANSRQLTIQFQLNTSDHVLIRVVDMAGRQINELVNRTIAKGAYTFSFDASHLSKGAYVIQKVSGGSMETSKIIMTR